MPSHPTVEVLLVPPTPELELFARARVEVEPPHLIGRAPLGERRVVPIAGGRVEGPRLDGEILRGGSDWQIVTQDGLALLEASYVIRTSDGASIAVRNRGVRHGAPDVLARIAAGENVDPTEYYFRATPTFETGDPRYDWLNRVVAVASGARTRDAVLLAFYAVT
jgi:hypothetical protein